MTDTKITKNKINTIFLESGNPVLILNFETLLYKICSIIYLH